VIPARHPHVKWKKTGATGVLLNLVSGEYFELDGTAIAIWKAIDGRTPVAGIVRKLATAYGAPPTAVAKDVTAFLATLQKRKLIGRRGRRV
jgi:hypothetical protein